MPADTPTPPLSPDTPPPPSSPVQASSGQELHYCQSAWHVIGLWVRLIFCYMYSHPINPICPLNSPRQRHLVAKSYTNLGPTDLSSCSIVCNRLLSFQEYFAIDHLHFSYVTTYAPFMSLHPLLAPWHPHSQCRYLMVKKGTTAGQHDSWSVCGSYWCLVRCTPSPHPQVEACSGQGQYYIRSTWHLVSTWVRLTCLFEGTSGASSCGNFSSMSVY